MLMATFAPSLGLSQVDMVEKSLDVVHHLPKDESIGCAVGESTPNEKKVEPHVISPGHAIDFQPPVSLATTPTDNDLTNNSQSSPSTEVHVPEVSSTPHKSPPPQPSPTSPSFLSMTGFADLTDLALHSPSSQIIGTPFATDTTRFEYPFPETSSGEHPASPSPPLSNAFLTAIAQNGPTIGSPPHSLSAPPTVSPAAVAPATLALASYGLPHGEANVLYNPTHPKLKQNPNPPIPPSLAKKSKKWSLNLIGRRKSSSAQSTGSLSTPALSESSSTASTPAGSVARANNILDGGLSASPPSPVFSRQGRAP